MRDFFGFDMDSALVPGINGLALAHLSKLAYPPSDDATREDWVSAVDDFAEEHVFDAMVFESEETDTQGFVLYNETVIFVAFRGTELKPQDILTDAYCVKDPFCEGRVHAGFLRAFRSIWLDVYKMVRDLRQEHGRPVYLTGHSLGAALATLCCAAFIDHGIPVWGIGTFGCPRVGDDNFVAFLDNAMMPDRHHRYVNNNDIVARLPLEAQGYAHVGTPLVISADGDLMIDPSAWDRIKDRVHGYVEGLHEKGIDSFEDHGIRHYIDALERLQ